MESSKNNLFVTDTKRIAKFTCVSILLFFSLLTSNLIAQSYAKVNINNISTYVWNDGRMDIAPKNGSGFEYWKGTKRYSVYASGVYWGGYFNNEIRVGGTTYSSSLRPGNESGDTIIYKVRSDYKIANLSGEINDEGKSEEEIRARYEKDYNDWPVHLGAPFYDVDQNGLFKKGKDIPGFPNADQTLWQVCNDFEVSDYNISSNPFYSKQSNVELQITTWAYSKYELLKGVVFKSYKLINKSKTLTIKDMYLGIFSDPDIGNSNDDYAGCDTTMNLAYVYNSKVNDSIFGENLTSYANLLLQSPIVDGANTDIAIQHNIEVRGKRNIGMSSFYATSEENVDTDGTLSPRRPYNRLLGLSYYYGRPSYDPISKRNTKFPLSGDPVTKSGFIDGILNPAGDRFIQINSGPFNMAPGDTQEVIFAQIVTSGTSRLGLVTYLKYLAKYVKDFYENEMFKDVTEANKPTEIPMLYSLSQNFPNPFNPSTTIEYSIPKSEHVTLKVFDVLGREVATLVDEFKQAGAYKTTFNASGLVSGVYFYQLNAGNYVETKKLIILK